MTSKTQLTIRTEQDEKAIILCLAGRVDGTNASVLDEAVRDKIDAGQPALLFDFDELEYISSAGLRVLLLAARRMQADKGKTLFCGLSEQIAEVFRVSGFDHILPVFGTRSEALATV